MIYYLNSYVDVSRIPDRAVTVAANSKTKYILDILAKKHKVVSISLAKSNGKKLKKESYVEGNITFQYLSSPSIDCNNSTRKMQINGILFLLKKVKKGDILIVYYSLFWIRILKILKRIKRFTLILELNDFYRYHFEGEKSKEIANIENEFFGLPDAYILANPDMKYGLDKLIGLKPAIINYGPYLVVGNDNNNSNDSIIRVLYSGVAEKLRKAAFLAASSASFLPSDYELHLACYGTEENLKELKKMIEEHNEKVDGARIVYHGTLNSSQLEELMKMCDIALSCHSYTEDEKYKAMFSFPSKIPLNMGAGLYIVSPKIPTFVGTPFDKATVYFDEFTPQSIANAVIKAGNVIRKGGSKNVPKSVVKELDKSFKKDVEKLIQLCI